MKQPKETRIALLRLSEAEFHTGSLLEGQRNQVRTSKIWDTYAGVKGGTCRLPSVIWTDKFPRMKRYHTNHMYEASRTEQSRLHTEQRIRENAHQESGIELFKKWKNWKRFAVLKLRKLKITNGWFFQHELRESQSTVNQLTVQIQVLRDGVNYPTDSRDFLKAWNSQQLWIIPRIQSSFNCSEFIWKAFRF